MVREFESFQDDLAGIQVQELRHKAYEDRRLEHMRLVRAAKKKLIKTKAACFSGTLSDSTKTDALASSTMVEQEKKRIQKTQQRHQGEIQNMLGFELRRQDMQNAAAKQLAAAKDAEKKEQLAVTLRAKKRNEERRRRAEQTREEEEAENKQKKELAYQMYLVRNVGPLKCL